MSIAALAAYRKARAVELALGGHSYEEIAHELGLANRGTAWHMVQNALNERLFAAVDAYRAAELKRLQRVEDALWPKAMAGNYRAGNAVLNVMDKRIRLLGLDQATRESNRCTCECPIHGSHGSWRPTPRPEDLAERFDPPSGLVADVEERMEAWVDEIGIWAVFEVMTMIAQVMEMVAGAGEVDGSAQVDARVLTLRPASRDSRGAPGSRATVKTTPVVGSRRGFVCLGFGMGVDPVIPVGTGAMPVQLDQVRLEAGVPLVAPLMAR